MDKKPYKLASRESKAEDTVIRIKNTAIGGVFHIWGHSWEIEKYKMWDELELFFKFVKKFNNIEFIFNSEIVDLKL